VELVGGGEMSGKRRMLHSQSGFTLVELMTVLIILGIILGIGVPKYLQIQAKSGWEADVDTIANFARAAEIYAASNNEFHKKITLGTLIDNKLIDGDIQLNRKNNKSNISVKNKGEATGLEKIGTTHKDVPFSLNTNTGNVNNLGRVIQHLIGNPPYGTGPKFPSDDSPVVDWTSGIFITTTNLPVNTP
jgi:prepilin-type N-terminal cleavage/methylation domain-containing protein